jgi:hypothetical protein
MYSLEKTAFVGCVVIFGTAIFTGLLVVRLFKKRVNLNVAKKSIQMVLPHPSLPPRRGRARVRGNSLQVRSDSIIEKNGSSNRINPF